MISQLLRKYRQTILPPLSLLPPRPLLPRVANRVALLLIILLLPLASLFAQSQQSPAADRPRARELGFQIGVLPTGKLNAITDVAGVRVGHVTLIAGDDVRTGVTVVLPHPGNIFQQKVPAAFAVGNGFGKFVGSTQVNELGVLETPIALTNTLNTFLVADALISYTLNQPENQSIQSVNPVVGECNDGWLNDIRVRRVKEKHVLQAIANAHGGPVEEGCVGGGVGTRCMGWKGGIGTSSRVIPQSAGGYTVGVLVQTNFSGVLNIAGVPVGRELGRYYLKSKLDDERSHDQGSCIVVIATDAPLDARLLDRLARRGLLGLAAVGSPMTNGSGDYVIAFSTNKDVRVAFESDQPVETRPALRNERMSPLFLAAYEATDEAVVNSMLKATTVTGYQDHTTEAIPIDRVIEVGRRYGAIHD